MRLPLNLKLALLFSAFSLSGNYLRAQLGVSPSMNSSFLTELRARNPQRADEGRDVLGDARQMIDAGHELSRPELFSATLAQAQRLEADITGFPGQHQLGRRWLSPFYHGVVAPEATVTNASGLSYGVALEQTFEFNKGVLDNSDSFFYSPTLLFDGSYQISANQRFTFSGGVGLNWDIEDDRIRGEYFTDTFGLSVLPGTSLAYDLTLGPMSFTAYDRVSVKPYLGFLQNDLGLAGTWQMTEKWSWTLNYTFAKTFDVDGDYGSFYPRGVNSDLHTASSMITFQSSGSWSAGLEGSMNWYRPEEGYGVVDNFWLVQADPGEAWSLGAFLVWNFNKDTRLRLAAGYQHQTFDLATDWNIFPNPFDVLFALNQPVSEDLNKPYYSISFSQRLSDRLSHELAAGYESNLDRVTNNNSSHFVNYSISGEPWKKGRLTASAFYELSGESKQIFATDAASYGVDLHLAQRLTSKLTASLSYSYVDFVPDKNSYDFMEQHIAGASLSYAITAKTQIQLAWQSFFTATANDAPWFNFRSSDDAQRGSVSVRMQF